jgi:lipoprotein-releasing system ATP-binding protein
MIKAESIHKAYGKLKVLKGVNLNVKKGEVVSIIGASGAGKSTLLHIIGTIDNPDQGKVYMDDIETTSLSSKKLAKIRNKKIGFIFQFHHLLPEFSALENIYIPGFIAGKSIKELQPRAEEIMDFLNITKRATHKPSELSGGEQQRVAVARALINNPNVILADEPSGNLDSNIAKELHQLFFDLREKFNQTFIIVTHNDELANMADRKLEMADGLMK